MTHWTKSIWFCYLGGGICSLRDYFQPCNLIFWICLGAHFFHWNFVDHLGRSSHLTYLKNWRAYKVGLHVCKKTLEEEYHVLLVCVLSREKCLVAVLIGIIWWRCPRLTLIFAWVTDLVLVYAIFHCCSTVLSSSLMLIDHSFLCDWSTSWLGWLHDKFS